MQKANRAHMLYAMMTFIHLQNFLHILFYLRVASVISSMEFSETFSEIKIIGCYGNNDIIYCFCIVTFYCIQSILSIRMC